MISYSGLLLGINTVLKSNFPNIKRPSGDIQSGFEKPAFFVQLIPINDDDYNDYSNQNTMIDIHYFSKLKTNADNLAMADNLKKLFSKSLKVGDRILTITNRKHEIVNNILQFKFNLNITNSCDFIKIANEENVEILVPESEIKENLGYTEDNIKIASDLEFNTGGV